MEDEPRAMAEAGQAEAFCSEDDDVCATLRWKSAVLTRHRLLSGCGQVAPPVFADDGTYTVRYMLPEVGQVQLELWRLPLSTSVKTSNDGKPSNRCSSDESRQPWHSYSLDPMPTLTR